MDENQLHELLKQPESAKLEFKSQMYKFEGRKKNREAQLEWNELIKDLISLANGNIGTANQEGYLVIGVANELGENGTRETYDIGEVKLTQTQLLNALGSYCNPPFQNLSIESILIDGEKICVVTIPPSDYLYELDKALKTKTQEFSEGSVLLRRLDGERIYRATDEERARIRKEKENRHKQESALYKDLTSYQHIKSEIQAGSFSELLDSYGDSLKPSHRDISEAQKEDLILIQAALRTSKKIITSDTTQIASQLIGRLAFSHKSGVQKILEEAEENEDESEQPWLKPLSASLQAPVASLRYSFKVDDDTSIQVVALALDSSKLIAGCANGTLKIWDLSSGKSIKNWRGHDQPINYIVITPDEAKIISASEDCTIKVWDVDNGTRNFPLEGHQAEINAIAVTPDGEKAIAAFDDSTIQVWSLTTGEDITPRELSNHPFGDAPTNLVIPNDGKYIVFTVDTKIYIWQQSDNSLFPIEAHDGKIKSLILFPCNHLLLSVSDDDTLKIWNLDDKICKGNREGIFVKNVIVTPDEESVVFITDDDENPLQIWDWKLDKLKFLKCDQKSISALAITPDGRRLITASSGRISGYAIYVWDWQSKQPLTKLADHANTITQFLITPNNRYLISVSEDKTIKVWDLLGDQTLDTPNKHIKQVENIVITPNGEYTISVSEDSLKLWRTNEGECWKEFSFENKIDQIKITDQRCVFSSDNNIFFIKNIQSENPELVQLGGHASSINDFVLTPDDKYVISASDDKVENLKVWDLSSETLKQSLEGHDDPAMLLDINDKNQWLISVSSSKTLIWSLVDFKLLYSFDGEHQALNQPVRNIRISSKDNFHISVENQDLKIWDLSVGRLLCVLKNRKDQVETIAISSDMRYLAFPDSTPDKDSTKLMILDIGENLEWTFADNEKTVTSIALMCCDRHVVSTSSDSTLKVWGLDNLGKSEDNSNMKQPIATFTGDSEITICAISSQNIIVAGEKSGRVHFLELRL